MFNPNEEHLHKKKINKKITLPPKQKQKKYEVSGSNTSAFKNATHNTETVTVNGQAVNVTTTDLSQST